jgi:uncharacterized protein YbjT (DUF2867 family)
MKIVVIGGSGRIGAKVVSRLREQGHDALAASPRTGVNTLTGVGVDEALKGASAVIDVSEARPNQGTSVQDFFETSTRTILAAEERAGVSHHVALSVVGTHRLPGSAYFRAKIAQETLIKESLIPYTIVQATQFFEFFSAIADATTEGDTVRLTPRLVQPIAADDVAQVLAETAAGVPVNGTIEIAGPETFPLAEFVRRGLKATNDPRTVIADPDAGYFGAMPDERTLVPHGEAVIGQTCLDDWLKAAAG